MRKSLTVAMFSALKAGRPTFRCALVVSVALAGLGWAAQSNAATTATRDPSRPSHRYSPARTETGPTVYDAAHGGHLARGCRLGGQQPLRASRYAALPPRSRASTQAVRWTTSRPSHGSTP